jgi:hypothetical protein
VQNRRREVSLEVYQQINRHRSGGMRLVDINARRSGRGDQYQFDVQFSGENSGRYRMQIYLLNEQGEPQRVLVQDLIVPNKFDRYGLGISAKGIMEMFPTFSSGKNYPAVVVLTLIIDQFGSIDPGWINSTWPASTRSQIHKTDLQF